MAKETFDNETQQVVDFGQVRAQKLEEKRRATERVFFKSLLSVYSVVGDHSMCPIEIIDLSEEGLSFQLPHDAKSPWTKGSSEFPVRLYFSQDSYLEVFVKMQNSKDAIENHARYVRYGCSVDTTTTSYLAYVNFVRFLKMYADVAKKDQGDVKVFYL